MDQPSERLLMLGEIARAAGAIAQVSRKVLSSELKPDGTIVTNGDRAVETFLRKELPAFHSDAGFWGEEFGHDGGGTEGLWVVDPIDGTSNFSYGSPLWGVSIGLLKAGKIELGALYLADLDELYLSEAGKGAFLNASPIKPIPPGEIKTHQLIAYGDGLPRLYPELKLPGKMRLSGSFVVDGAFTIMQRFRGLIGHRERLYDVAACVGLATELGADVRYVDGDPFDLDEISQPVKIQKPWIIFPTGSEYHG